MPQKPVEFRSRVFGATCHICVEDKQGGGRELLSLAETELIRLEEKFSPTYSNSVIAKVNCLAGRPEFTPLDKEAHSLFEFATALWEQSHHQFDPSAIGLQSCYNDTGLKSGSNASLADLLTHVDWSKVELNSAGVRIVDEGTQIDLDTCVLPYAVDCIRRTFCEQGVSSALISLDDNIATIGKQADGANWLIGVKSPKSSGVAITRIKLTNQGYSVRGNFQRRLLISGENYGRALSPIDGQPIPGLLSIGVIADTCLTACGAATVC